MCKKFVVIIYLSFIFFNIDYVIEDCLCLVGIIVIILVMLCIICGDKNEKLFCKWWYDKVVFDNS